MGVSEIITAFVIGLVIFALGLLVIAAFQNPGPPND